MQISGPPTCPTCGEQTRPRPDGDGRLVRVCAACGWGQERLDAKRAGIAVVEPRPQALVPTRGALILYWVVTAALVAGVLALVVVFWAYSIEILIGFVLYLAASNALTPKWDSSELGLMGLPIDNPFSFHDDWNRAMLWLNILFIPGKFAGLALMGSIRAAKASKDKR